MKTALYKFSEKNWSKHPNSQLVDPNLVQLVLCFASKAMLRMDDIYATLKLKFVGGISNNSPNCSILKSSK